MATISPLRQRMIEDMMIRNLSPATQQSYIYAVAKFSRHFGCPPDQLSLEQVRSYQLHLIRQKRSWSHVNQVACALRFLYGITLGQTEAFERIVGGYKPDKLPLVLSAEEIARFLQAVSGVRNRVVLTTAYAAGLRVGEATRLKVSSIDSKRMLIHIENGKGGETATQCCPRGSWRFYVPIGSGCAQACGCFQAAIPADTSLPAQSKAHAGLQGVARDSANP